MRKSEWLLGLLTVLIFLGIAASESAARLEGLFLHGASGFSASPVDSGDVVVVDTGKHLEAAQWKELAKVLGRAKVVGVVSPGPVPAAVRALDPVYAVPFSSASALQPDPLPESIEATAIASLPSDPWRYLPGVLTGRLPEIARLHLDRIPSKAVAAPADFIAGESNAMFRLPLLRAHQDGWLPGFALRVALAASDDDLSPRRFTRSVFSTDVGPLSTDRSYRVYPKFPRVDVPVFAPADMLERRFDAAGKVVLLGIADPARVEPVRLVGGELVAPVVAEARAVAALLDRAVYQVPAWGTWVQLGALFIAGLLVAVAIPRMHPWAGLFFLLLCLFVAATVEFGLITLQTTFLPLLIPAVALVSGSLAVWVKTRHNRRLEAVRGELEVTNRLLAEAYRAQGQLDAAFARYRRCRLNDGDVDQLYALGMDFERRRQFAKAAAVFEQVADVSTGFRDTSERLRRNREADTRLSLGKGGANSATATLILDASGLARPTIGRYELERELGRGAMGLVYLGRDPRIGRTVAIKTVSLAEEFEGRELNAVRERFFREAETAGRLDHPNIVTIYDVGEEQDLAYIAMDYLKGESLAAYCQPDNLLPVPEVIAIGIQVAEALDYAHSQGVIHRDIKPANLLYDRGDQMVKVTDFGVACLTDNSKTRTGTVLGSPSYMSPEQVAGQKVDGRSDIFSLGVTLFQLFTGELPFKADSLASLMYQIANERHADIRSLRDVPSCVSRLINRSLNKDAGKRFQRGTNMVDALRRCLREAEQGEAA